MINLFGENDRLDATADAEWQHLAGLTGHLDGTAQTGNTGIAGRLSPSAKRERLANVASSHELANQMEGWTTRATEGRMRCCPCRVIIDGKPCSRIDTSTVETDHAPIQLYPRSPD